MSEPSHSEPTPRQAASPANPAATGEPAQKALVSETPLLEWLVAGVGLLLVLGVLGFTLYRALYENSSPPEVSVEVEAILPQDAGYIVTFRVLNRGETTAAALTIEGALRQGAEEIELSTATLDYAPPHSERRGGLYFTHDPQQYELQLRATGYAEP